MFERILVDPKICHGKPVIKGTRVLVSVVLGYLAKGSSVEQVIEDFPQVSKEDILEAISFGSYLSNFESFPYDLKAS
ncbi:MAG: hypothetical protein FD143_399 [Ignavibacteria bacterium]|nr:MAG: hypothetical protein FD143_399 [Ignavibacteria bacterium]KAF0160333.1 MAG: hypothetical protein FD188_1835 [Ignavibacteria bacterium]